MKAMAVCKNMLHFQSAYVWKYGLAFVRITPVLMQFPGSDYVQETGCP
jgi:hypothetical protein